MNWYSVRVRLTLWNVLVLACVLGGFGTALCYAVQANQSVAIDRQLAERARGPRGPGGPGGPIRFPFGLGGGPFRERADRRLAPPQEGPRDIGNEGPPPTEAAVRPGEGPQSPGERSAPEGGGRFRFQRRMGRWDREPVKRKPGDVGPAPIEINGQIVREYRRPLLFDERGKPGDFSPDDLPWDPATLQAALSGREVYSTITVDGEKLRVLSAPAMREGRRFGAVQVALPLGEQERLAESQYRTLLLLIPLAIAVAALGGLFLTDRALRPVRDITHTAAQIGAEDLSQRLEVKGKDELAELSSTFNGMIARLESAFVGLEGANAELAEAYGKLERAYQEQRRFTGDASHELRTPLTRIKGSTSLALCGPHDADSYREALEVADQAADAMARIVQDLLLLARSDAGQLPVRLASVGIEEVLNRSLHGLETLPGAPVRIDVPRGRYHVLADADHLARLFTNLLENALRHTPADGSITVAARASGTNLIVDVADTGEGIPAEHLPRVCERFYRVDAARTAGRGGTGLGLAICQSIIQAHHGRMSIGSRPGQGTTVTVTIPLAVEPQPAALREPAAVWPS